jgi:uncharacterized protein YgbK (DUF1537 family)
MVCVTSYVVDDVSGDTDCSVMREWVVVADDRTGALEVAGEMATSLGPVVVTVGDAPDAGAGSVVVDIGSRHMTRSAAAERAAAVAGEPARRHAHKIDSLLRGNWAAELVAVQQATGERVLLVPALPRLGRVCRDGVVHVDGVPVGGRDARRAALSPRPADHLSEAGAADVVELAGADAVEAWLTDGAAVAVCDATTDADLSAIAAAWHRSVGIRLAGTAGSIAAAVAPVSSASAPVPLVGEVLVVCGSLHATARAQLDALGWRSDVTVVSSPLPADPVVADADAARMAADLGAAARKLLDRRPFGVVVIIGGDTAAAVLGDEPLVVGGTLAPGVPWSRRVDGDGPLVVTKAGGFGHRDTLVDLLAGRRPSEER